MSSGRDLVINRKDNKISNFITIIILVILYISIGTTQKYIKYPYVSGVIVQLNVAISVFLAVQIKGYGSNVALFLNTLSIINRLALIFMTHNLDLLPGVFVCTSTICIILIIRVYGRKLRRAIDTLTYQANYDILTGLPNRRNLVSKMSYTVQEARDHGLSFYILSMNFSNFKLINDSTGHHAGDDLLINLANRMKTVIHKEDYLARFGGVEFTLIINSENTEEELKKYVDDIVETVSKPMTIENRTFPIKCGFGASKYPQDGSTSGELIKCATIALHRSNEENNDALVCYEDSMYREITRRLEFENKILCAFRQSEFYVVFQPQYYAENKRMVGCEVLMRWKDTEGMISPGKFIPVAEEIGLIVQMGEWVLREACRVKKKLPTDLMMSVNVSSVQLMTPGFTKMVEKILKEYNVKGEEIELEITESVFISSFETVLDILKELKRMNVRVAIDDFGTGFSSLSYLWKLPIDTLKIDKSFIDDIHTNNNKRRLVDTIISMSHDFRMRVVAEGVENIVQLNYMKESKCDIIQGFLWGRPVEENEYIKLCNNQ